LCKHIFDTVENEKVSFSLHKKEILILIPQTKRTEPITNVAHWLITHTKFTLEKTNHSSSVVIVVRSCHVNHQ